MCKLCGSSTKNNGLPNKRTVNNNEAVIKFKAICFDYIQEDPCAAVRRQFMVALYKNPTMSIDQYIIKRLEYLFIAPNKINAQQYKQLKRRHGKKCEYAKNNYEIKLVSKCIHQVYNKAKGTSSYDLQITIKNLIYRNVFKTLSEAIQERDSLINGTSLHQTPASRSAKKLEYQERYTYKSVEPNIMMKTHRSKNFAPSYKFETRINNSRINKTFKTLEEAQQFKQGVLNGDYQHNSVAA